MKKNLNKIYKSLKGKFVTKTITHNKREHVLVHGDCFEVMKYLPDRSIDLIITDPPYNQHLNYGAGFHDNKSWGEYYGWLKRRLDDIPRILKPTGSLYLISYPEINARILPFLEDTLGLELRRWITWHYPTNIGHSSKNYTRSQRSILFFVKTKNYIFNREYLTQHYKNPTAPVIRKRLAQGYRGRTSYDLLRFLDLLELQKGLIDVFDIDLLKNNSKDRFRNLKGKFHPMKPKELRQKDHPCQLPLGLLELFIKVSSNKGGVVFDPFAGTFTTSVAAEKLGRSSVGVELNGKYINFGTKRLNQS